jgi:hypothetical protein
MAMAMPRLQEGELALHCGWTSAFVGDQQLASSNGIKIVAILFELRKLG